MKNKYRFTVYACFLGYIVQAITVNFAPLLFLTFQRTYGIPLTKITLLITINFALQMTTDLVSVKLIDVIGYRVAAVTAHITSFAGLVALTILPDLFPDPFVGLLLSVILYGVGGGLLEVIVSPIVEACVTEHDGKTMSLLHSFYCWGCVGVITLSTVFFAVFGIENWRYAALIWSLAPLFNTFAFLKVPFAPLVGEGEKKIPLRELLSDRFFWIAMLMMFSAGSSELAVSQWASAFAEAGLGVEKAVGDLAGATFFAVMMGLSRTFYGKFGDKIPLRKFMGGSGILCIVSYFMIRFAPTPVLSLIGCGVCGLSAGIMWPGTFSMSSNALRRGGTALFALLALAGDVGCTAGPTLVGFVSGACGGDLKTGIFAAVVFPLLLIVGLILFDPEKAKVGKTKTDKTE